MKFFPAEKSVSLKMERAKMERAWTYFEEAVLPCVREGSKEVLLDAYSAFGENRPIGAVCSLSHAVLPEYFPVRPSCLALLHR